MWSLQASSTCKYCTTATLFNCNVTYVSGSCRVVRRPTTTRLRWNGPRGPFRRRKYCSCCANQRPRVQSHWMAVTASLICAKRRIWGTENAIDITLTDKITGLIISNTTLTDRKHTPWNLQCDTQQANPPRYWNILVLTWSKSDHFGEQTNP